MSDVIIHPDTDDRVLAKMERDALLRELDVEMPQLVDTALAIERQRRSVRIPSAMPGSHAAGMTTLEDGLAGKYILRRNGWFCVLAHKGGKARIVVAAGTEETGLIGAGDIPVNSVVKGKMMEMAVRDSGGVVSGYTPLLSVTFERPLYVFLYYVPPRGGIIRAELSRPTGIRNGLFIGWRHPRIIVENPGAPEGESPEDESTKWTDEPEIEMEERDDPIDAADAAN